MLGLRHAIFRTGCLSGHEHLLLLAVILSLSAYTHLWNPAGFPQWEIDEGVYIDRALDVLDHHKMLVDKHDHPFLGWTILAGFFHATGYPDSFVTPEDTSSLGMLYGAPRILMGLLAVLDTFLIYKIAERGFGRRAAPIAAVLFATMPLSLTLRLVLLDSIFLPFVLSSVLLAMYARGPFQVRRGGGELLPQTPDKTRLMVLLSGACMGCAMLVKIPSLVMIPLVLALVWSIGRRPGRMLLLWLASVIIIAAAWPAAAALTGDFDGWVNGVLWQADRDGQSMLNEMQMHTQVALHQDQDPDILTHPAIMLWAVVQVFATDPVMVSLGTAGLAFALAVRNRFLVLWFVPVSLFFGSIGYVSYSHLGMLWTAMCIAAAALIGSGIERASAGRLGSSGQRTLLLAAVLVIAALGLSTSGVLVHWDVTSVYSEAVSFTLQNYADSEAGIIMLQFHESWLPQAYNLTDSGMVVYDFFGKHTAQPQKTKKIVIVDYNDRNHRQMNKMETSRGGDNATASLETDWIRRYSEIYNGGNRVAEFENAPKPDILIPSVVIPHVDRSVEVREWNPPGWASLSTYGPAGRALDLDDTAHITLATAPVLDLGVDDPFSIAFWIKNTGLGDPDSSIISKDDADMHQGITVWNRPGGGISLMMTDNAQDQIGTSTFSSVADGRWHHVVFTYDGSGSSGGLDVYVDGQIDRRGKHVMLLSEYAANEYLLKIDANSIGGGPAQDTVLDDVMIYSALLPASYVSAAHECHVEMAVLADEDTETAVEHTCMGDYDGALLVHLGFEDGLSDSLGVGGT